MSDPSDLMRGEPLLGGFSPAAADARHDDRGGDESVIPQGMYCYSAEPGPNGFPRFRPCPYWGAEPTRGVQEYGYCARLKQADWHDDWGLLCDQVKACGVNEGPEDLDAFEAAFEGAGQ